MTDAQTMMSVFSNSVFTSYVPFIIPKLHILTHERRLNARQTLRPANGTHVWNSDGFSQQSGSDVRPNVQAST
jgi:hypothetical protein